MYKKDDMIMYSKIGVCQVIEVGKIDNPCFDMDKDYYTLKPMFENGVVYAPIDTPLPMRYVMPKEEVDKMIDMIPDIEMGNIHMKRAYDIRNAFNERIKTQQAEDLIVVLKTLLKKDELARNSGKSISTTDQNYMRQAESLLYGEFAVALGIEFDEVEEYIKKRLGEL